MVMDCRFNVLIDWQGFDGHDKTIWCLTGLEKSWNYYIDYR